MIAILGDKEEFRRTLMEIIGKLDLRLLFVSEGKVKSNMIKVLLESLKTTPEFEYISCERE